MKTYIINLEKDTDRRKYMERLLVGSPFTEPEFVKAVYGKALSAQEKAEIFDQKHFGYVFNKKATDGEIGCAASHYKVWNKIIDGKDNVAFILEDDLKFDADFSKFVDWSLRWLDSSEPRVVLYSHYFFYFSWELGSEDGIEFSTRPRRAYGTYCYGINKAAVDLLVSLGRPHYLSDDWGYFQRHGLKLRAPVKHPVRVDYGLGTNIGQRCANIISDWDAGARLVAPYYFSRAADIYLLILCKLRVLCFFSKG